MPDSPNIHWTTDEHLLAEYVLGHLDASQTAGLESHLRDCAQCRDAVKAEQQLAAGVRRAGRDELKQRLVQQLSKKETGTNWYKVAGVAAVFVLLLTVGIYDKWFFSGEPQLADSLIKSDSVAAKTETTPQHQAPPQESPEGTRFADAAKPAATDGDLSKSKGGGVRGAERDTKERQGGRAKRGLTNLPAPGESGILLSKKDQMMAAAPQPEGTWVEGMVLAEEMNGRASGKTAEEGLDDVRENARKDKKEPAALMSLAAHSRSLSDEGTTVMVTQRAISVLPRNQIRRKQDGSQVQTLFRSDASGLSMVLYSDSLFKGSDLGQARIQTIREDSIILRVGNQRIGYRLPRGLTEQLAKQLKQAK